MDIKLQTKNKKKRNTLLVAALLLTCMGLVVYLRSRPQELTIKRSEVLLKKVKNGAFEDFIIFQAQVEPLHAQLINIIEGGAIQELYVENGADIIAGMPLARLYNPITEFNFLAQETGIIEQINQLNVAKLNIRNQEFQLSKEQVLIEHDFNAASMENKLNNTLYEKKILAKNIYDASAEKLRYQMERKEIIQKSITKEKENNTLQIQQINQALSIMEKSLETLRNNKKNFLVLAPSSGRLSAFDVTLGQNIAAGTAIGKIDKMMGYKLTAQVDEYYLEKLTPGLTGSVLIKERTQPVQVTKILPEVKEGKFKVELEFMEGMPMDLQVGLSFGVNLQLSDTQQKLLLPKGSFYTHTQGKWIFVLKKEKAIRRNIALGRENAYYYEVLDGLAAEDEVVVSNYDDFKHIEILTIPNR